MDQEDYYTNTSPSNKKSSCLITKNKEIIKTEHINKMHNIINNFIKKNRIDNSFILDLKYEINNYNIQINKFE